MKRNNAASAALPKKINKLPQTEICSCDKDDTDILFTKIAHIFSTTSTQVEKCNFMFHDKRDPQEHY